MTTKKTVNSTARFIAEIPEKVNRALKDEAEKSRRSRKAQLTRILEERYGFVPDDQKQAERATA
jgi:predicted metal-dependent peptidase